MFSRMGAGGAAAISSRGRFSESARPAPLPQVPGVQPLAPPPCALLSAVEASAPDCLRSSKASLPASPSYTTEVPPRLISV